LLPKKVKIFAKMEISFIHSILAFIFQFAVVLINSLIGGGFYSIVIHFFISILFSDLLTFLSLKVVVPSKRS